MFDDAMSEQLINDLDKLFRIDFVIELFSVLALIIIVLLIVIFGQKRKLKVQKRNNNKLFNILKQQGLNVSNQFKQQDIDFDIKNNNYNEKTSEIEREFNLYRKLVNKNFRQVFSSGELILIDFFKQLLKQPEYENCNIYGHLNMKDGIYRTYQADFFVVSNKGLFVIESKFWKGITLIYSNGYSTLFTNTQFFDYGKGSDKEITVFNISQSNLSDKLEINKYTNPVAQARQYSKILRNYFNILVQNVVVFQEDEDCQIKFNDKKLVSHQVD